MTIMNKKKELMKKMITENVVQVILSLITEGHNITMDEVASRCGVSKGTIYNYFTDRQSLLDYVHEEILKPFSVLGDDIFGSDDEPLAKIYRFIDSLFDTPKELQLYFKFIQKERTVAQDGMDRFNLITRHLADVCEEGIEKGDFVDFNKYVLAEMIYGLLIGPCTMPEGCYDLPEDDLLREDVKQLIKRILLKN